MMQLQRLRAAPLLSAPFAHARLSDVFALEDADALARELPRDGFRSSVGREGHYLLEDLSLVDGGALESGSERLTPRWRALVDQLRGSAYRDALADLTRTDLRASSLKLRLCRYQAGCWMLPHTDRPDRLVTQVIYLHRQWEPHWGGTLDVLSAPDERAIVFRYLPAFNSSVVFVRSERSFHQVARVAEGVTAPRLSLLAQFVRAESGAAPGAR